MENQEQSQESTNVDDVQSEDQYIDRWDVNTKSVRKPFYKASKRDSEFVAIKAFVKCRDKNNEAIFYKPGEDYVGSRGAIRRRYKKGLIGPKGHPWTENAIKHYIETRIKPSKEIQKRAEAQQAKLDKQEQDRLAMITPIVINENGTNKRDDFTQYTEEFLKSLIGQGSFTKEQYREAIKIRSYQLIAIENGKTFSDWAEFTPEAIENAQNEQENDTPPESPENQQSDQSGTTPQDEQNEASNPPVEGQFESTIPENEQIAQNEKNNEKSGKKSQKDLKNEALNDLGINQSQ